MQVRSETRMVQMEQMPGGLWGVHEVGHEDLMASFNDIEACVDYACGLERENKAVVVQGVQ